MSIKINVDNSHDFIAVATAIGLGKSFTDGALEFLFDEVLFEEEFTPTELSDLQYHYTEYCQRADSYFYLDLTLSDFMHEYIDKEYWVDDEDIQGFDVDELREYLSEINIRVIYFVLDNGNILVVE